jgi:hypothetical protein
MLFAWSCVAYDNRGSDPKRESVFGIGAAMTKITLRIPEDMQRWIEARKRFNLSHVQVQMARELGMNPRKLGSLANHKQEPWKASLPVFIEQIYRKRFGKTQPDRVVTIEERVQEIAAKKAEKRERRQRAESLPENPTDPPKSD